MIGEVFDTLNKLTGTYVGKVWADHAKLVADLRMCHDYRGVKLVSDMISQICGIANVEGNWSDKKWNVRKVTCDMSSNIRRIEVSMVDIKGMEVQCEVLVENDDSYHIGTVSVSNRISDYYTTFASSSAHLGTSINTNSGLTWTTQTPNGDDEDDSSTNIGTGVSISSGTNLGSYTSSNTYTLTSKPVNYNGQIYHVPGYIKSVNSDGTCDD